MGREWDNSIEGMTERTERAFRQDAELAMGADPVRAIVELVTNSDDAYVKQGNRRKGSIRIEVDRRRKRAIRALIAVKDRAGGMTLEEMQERLGKEAARTSGFEGQYNVRGLLGRGAKDCAAFGKVTWRSVTVNELALWELQPSGRYKAHRRKLPPDHQEKRGTSACLEVDSRFALKNHANLREALNRHYELRPCLLDRQGREVHLVDVNQDRDDHLLYEAPKGNLVVDERIQIEGFMGEYARVHLWFSEENLDDGWDREYWRHGLLIASGRAAYEVFGGKFEREQWSPYFGHFFGDADVPGINRLIKEYDDRIENGLTPNEENPVRLVTRDRRGLVKEHPFALALARTLESFLAPHLEQFRKEREAAAGKAGVTEDTVRRLRSLGKVVGRFLEEEQQVLGEGDGGQPSGGLQVIPTAQVTEPGAVARYTVRFRPEAASWPDTSPTAAMQLLNGAAAVIPEEMELKDRGDYFSRSFTVANLPEGEICEVEVRVGDYITTCLLECRHTEAPDSVDTLQFEHSTYRIKDSGTRSLAVLAPWELVADEGVPLQLSIVGDPSITIDARESAFVYDYVRQCGRSSVIVQGRGVRSRAKITAAIGEQIAVAELEVAVSGSGDISFVFVDKSLPQRALWDGNTLKISVVDKSVARYIGPYPELPGQGTIHFRTMMAELVAYHAVRRVLEGRRKGLPADALTLYRDHMQLERKIVPRVHAALVSQPEIEGAARHESLALS